MLHKTSGIVFHTTKYSDTSLIVKIFTKQFGLQTYIISGARSKKSKTRATLFQPLALMDLVVSHSEKGGLQRISEINSQHPFISILNNITKSSIVLFLNEVLYKAVKEAHNDDDLFEFIKNSLLLLDLKTDSCANFHIHFILQLTKYLGFFPQGKYSKETSIFDLQEGNFINTIPKHQHCLNKEQSELLNTFITSNYETINEVKIDKYKRKQLLQSLTLFYQLHIASFGEIKSLGVLEQVIA